MAIELALLGFFAERPAHGYEVYGKLSAADGLWQVWRVKRSHFYALLAKLEAERLLVATVEVQDMRPARRVYALTEGGRSSLMAWVRAPVDHGREMRIEFLAKLYCALHLDVENLVQLIRIQRELCFSWQEDMPRSDVRMTSVDGSQMDFAHAVLAFRKTQIDAFIAFLDLCEAQLT